MKDAININELFSQDGESVSRVIYSDSRVLIEDTTTTIYDAAMEEASTVYKMFE